MSRTTRKTSSWPRFPGSSHPPRPQRDGALEVTFEYGDDGILTVQIHDLHNGQKKRFAIQQSGADQLDAGQIMKMKRINEELIKRSEDLENTPEYRDALEVLKKTEQDVIPKVGQPPRQARAGGAVPAGPRGDGVRRPPEDGGRRRGLNDRLLNYAYLL